MQLDVIHIILFVVFNLVVVGTCLGSLWIMWREKKREPSAEWAAKLRESINTRLEGFRAELDPLRDLSTRLDDLKKQEERHHASVSKQIRDNIEVDEDEVTQTVIAVVQQHFRQLQQQMQQRPQQTRPVAPSDPGTDIDSSRSPIPGLRMNADSHS